VSNCVTSYDIITYSITIAASYNISQIPPTEMEQ